MTVRQGARRAARSSTPSEVHEAIREPLEKLERAAASGHVAAMVQLAKRLHSGEGARRDIPRAYALLEKAARAGDDSAMMLLGIAKVAGKHIPKDAETGIALLERAASGGDLEAAYVLGLYFLDGVGVDPNPLGGRRWLRAAAEAGLGRAQKTLGVRLREGRGGFDRDPDEAVLWLERAFDAGVTTAAPHLRVARFERLVRVRIEHTYYALYALGWALLAYEALTAGLGFDAVGVLFGIAAMGAVSLATMAPLLLLARGRRGMKRLAAEEGGPRPSPASLPSIWRIALRTPAEDGVFAMPLLHLGGSPWFAVLSALLFGFVHFPRSPLVATFPKALLVLPLYLWILPTYGLGTLVVVHAAWDILLVVLLRLLRAARRALWPSEAPADVDRPL